MNDLSMTVRGKDRYKSGVMEYKKNGLLGSPTTSPRDTDIIALFPGDAAGTASIRSRLRRRWPVNISTATWTVVLD